VLVFMILSLVGVLAACGSKGNPESSSANGAENQAATESPSASPAETQAESPAAEPKAAVSLEFATNASGGTLEAYKKIVAQFNQENTSNITIELNAISKDYDPLMNTRMATNDLPDLWSTAGWSVHRFSEYLRPLNDQPWAGQITDTIKPTI